MDLATSRGTRISYNEERDWAFDGDGKAAVQAQPSDGSFHHEC